MTSDLYEHLTADHGQVRISADEASDMMFLRSLHRVVMNQNPAEVTAACYAGDDPRMLVTRDEAIDFLIDAGWSIVSREFASADDVRRCLTRDQAAEILAARP